eukprot:scaffold9369_cov182-Amphora_coffeaeformis.AAC.12
MAPPSVLPPPTPRTTPYHTSTTSSSTAFDEKKEAIFSYLAFAYFSTNIMATEDDWKKIAKAVDQFYQRQDAGKEGDVVTFGKLLRTNQKPFREPVAYKELGLLDYPTIISKPMDLGTIKKKLKDRQYTSPAELNADVTLVWTNCMTYNQDGSDFFKLAASLKKKWDDRYSKLVKDLGVTEAAATAMDTSAPGAAPSAKAAGGSTTSRASLADRRSFAKSLYQITKEDLGKVLAEVEQKFPSALKRNSIEDELELNVDAIPAPLLTELTQFISSAKKRKNATTGKKAKTAKTASS